MAWTFYNASGEALTNFGPVALTDLDIDGATDIGANIADADLFIIDDGAGGTNRKTAASRLKTYIGGAGLVLIGTAVADDDATLTITGLDSTYDSYLIELSNMVPATDGATPVLRVGDSGGVDSGASDYGYVMAAFTDTTTTPENQLSTGTTGINWASAGVGNAAGEGVAGLFTLHRPGDGSMAPLLTGQSVFNYTSGNLRGNTIMAQRNAVITLDRVQFLFGSGNVKEGRMTIWGMAHA